MRCAVLHETPYIQEAILAANPVKPVSDACQDILNDEMFIHLRGGFVGGTLLNVTTAGFNTRASNAAQPLVERPLRVTKEPRSFIGRLAVAMLNQSLTSLPSSQDLALYKTYKRHFCYQAEDMFQGESIGCRDYRPEQPAVAAFDSEDNLVLYNKNQGADTAIILRDEGLQVDGQHLPAGTICAFHINDKPLLLIDLHLARFSSRARIAPFRLSVFAVPANEREATFTPPKGHEGKGMPLSDLADLSTLPTLRADLADQVRIKLSPPLHV